MAALSNSEQIKDAADKAEGIKPPEAEVSVGRPAKYEPTFVLQAAKLCALGATDVEMADFFGVHVSTLHRWKIEFPDFCDAIKSAKEVADERVERSLYQRAIGYTFESEKVFQFQGGVVRTPTREHVPPDTTAMIFWLKNRRPTTWRDVQKHEHGEVGAFDQMSADELRASIFADLEELGGQGATAAFTGRKGKAGSTRRPN